MSPSVADIDQRFKVTLYDRRTPSRSITALLGTDVPTVTDGGGGYQVITLPKRASVVSYGGRDAGVSLSLPIRFAAERIIGSPRQPSRFRPISPQVNQLIKMWRPDSDRTPPPVLKVRATNDLVPYAYLPYVLSDFEWGDAQADPAQAIRIIQDLTLTLLEYRADEHLQTQASRLPAANQTVYTVKKGDTLSSIAKRFGVTWKSIAAAQTPPITDPRKIKVGMKLSIPSSYVPATVASGFVPVGSSFA